jgi:hypothetical protein
MMAQNSVLDSTSIHSRLQCAASSCSTGDLTSEEDRSDEKIEKNDSTQEYHHENDDEINCTVHSASGSSKSFTADSTKVFKKYYFDVYFVFGE